jgi:type IV secretion system protein VirB9
MKLKKLVAAMALLPLAAQAQTPAPFVPEIQKGPLVAVVDPSMGMSEPPITLTPNDKIALKYVRDWKKNPDKPAPAPGGGVTYMYGNTPATLLCTLVHVCGVRLQPGERVNNANIGDDIRWKYSFLVAGSGASETVTVNVKPLQPNISTNMVITTDLGRTYHVIVKATNHEYIPYINFHYPEDSEKALAQYQAQRQKEAYGSTLSNGMNVANLDFGYKITGDNVSWKPIRVYSDGVKTYIEFDSLGNEAPVFVELQSKGGMFSDPETKIVNNRFIGKKLVVDGIPKLSALIVGVGKDQRMVTIERVGGSK